MREIIMPKTSTSNVDVPTGYQKFAIPDSMKDKDQISLFYEQINAVVTKIMELESTVNKYQLLSESSIQEMKTQSNRNIEVIGIFSSIIALLIINVNIIAASDTFLKAILLIISLTSSIAIFAIMIHDFFNPNHGKMKCSIWIPITVLIIILLIGILAQILDWKLLNTISKT